MLFENLRKDGRCQANTPPECVGVHLPGGDFKIFLFGSYASRTNQTSSDLDVGIWGKRRIAGHLLIQIEEELDNSRIPYKMDLVDFRRVSKDFRNVALKKIINL